VANRMSAIVCQGKLMERDFAGKIAAQGFKNLEKTNNAKWLLSRTIAKSSGGSRYGNTSSQISAVSLPKGPKSDA
jgi:hypothetical protein